MIHGIVSMAFMCFDPSARRSLPSSASTAAYHRCPRSNHPIPVFAIPFTAALLTLLSPLACTTTFEVVNLARKHGIVRPYDASASFSAQPSYVLEALNQALRNDYGARLIAMDRKNGFAA